MAKNFFEELEVGDEWTTVDATWPYGAKALGAPANEDFAAGVDQFAEGLGEAGFGGGEADHDLSPSPSGEG